MENKQKFRPNPRLKLMEQVRQVMPYHHYAYRTMPFGGQSPTVTVSASDPFPGSQPSTIQADKPSISAPNSEPQHHAVGFGLTHNANLAYTTPQKRELLSPSKRLFATSRITGI